MIYTDQVQRAAGFDWDDGNREKCRKHGVSIGEIETLFAGTAMIRPDYAHSEAERRHWAIGRTAEGRHLVVVFTLRHRDGGTLLRPISARYMHAKEIARYEEENPDVPD